jgi:hypothetical protein
MKFFNISIGILVILSITRFIPHPPNFTSIIALSFYVPILFNIRFLPIIILSFALTDLIIGFHNTMLFTWGSVLIIGLLSQFFVNKLPHRLAGAVFSCIIFYIITNLGVWFTGIHGNNSFNLLETYKYAIPFFWSTIMSTLLYSLIIEALYKLSNQYFDIKKIVN